MKDLVTVDKEHDDWNPKHIYDRFDFRLKFVKDEEMLVVYDDLAMLTNFFENKGVKFVQEFEGDDIWFYFESPAVLVEESFDPDSKITPMFTEFEKHVPGQINL